MICVLSSSWIMTGIDFVTVSVSESVHTDDLCTERVRLIVYKVSQLVQRYMKFQQVKYFSPQIFFLFFDFPPP